MPSREEIASVLRGRIELGTYPVGSKMPSTREVVEELGGSRTTASAALHLLAEEGWLVIKDKSAAVVCARGERRNLHDELRLLQRDLSDVQKRLNAMSSRLSGLLDSSVTHK